MFVLLIDELKANFLGYELYIKSWRTLWPIVYTKFKTSLEAVFFKKTVF